MDFGDDNNNNMFTLDKDKIGNTNVVWYSSSWDAPTTLDNTTAVTGQQPPLYGGGDGSHVQPDPHLTCLYLGKRHYFEETSNIPLGGLAGNNSSKRGRGGDKTAAYTVVPRCQVEGCDVALLNAKEYHRRHRVCDMHSKAPKVVVLGMDQRFCQQCSRFHVVSEFDESKRSCRRRLAGHNERRRKSSHHSVNTNSIQGCALSLLSSGSDSWLCNGDLSTRCSAALRELIAENRAAHNITRQQLVHHRDWPHHSLQDFMDLQPHSNYFHQHLFRHTQS